MTALIFAMLALLISAVFVQAGDSDNGERLAQRWCAACHVVAPNQQSANADAPPFATIAKKPGFDAGKVALFLLDPHPKMPNMSLSRGDADDIASYIATFAR